MDKLRKLVTEKLTKKDKTWYWLSTEANINPHIIYRFRDGDGISGDNTIKIILALNIQNNELS